MQGRAPSRPASAPGTRGPTRSRRQGQEGAAGYCGSLSSARDAGPSPLWSSKCSWDSWSHQEPKAGSRRCRGVLQRA
ncbi:hypothetical protein NDU88_003420 [Pleurodeles waltl]|uniref:Uncharacterized protein n=1 Tax=Pleurodeles waltl TaxID=8319 RepID=A0AAV7NJ74_PLEWA|nr:hypothetical protein NDU88_003420 [Pleurodeles waltl]